MGSDFGPVLDDRSTQSSGFMDGKLEYTKKISIFNGPFRVVPRGKSREEAEKPALEISSFPQACMNTDRLSAYTQWDLPLMEAMRNEFEKGFPMVELEGRSGAARFAGGAGRGGKFEFE